MFESPLIKKKLMPEKERKLRKGEEVLHEERERRRKD